MSKPLFYISLTVAWLGHFLVDMMIGIWPVYKTIAHIDLAIAGLISGSCAFFGEGLQLLFGTLSDRGYRKMLILGGVVASTASACFVYTDNYLCLFALYLITCIGSGAFHPCAASLIGDLPSSRKNLLVALFVSGGALGLAFSQIIFMHTYVWMEGHTAWLAVPAILLMAFSIFNKVGPAPTEENGQPKHHFNFKAFAGFFRHWELRSLYFTQVCIATMLWATMFLLPDVLSSRGYEPWMAFGGGHMAFILGGAIMVLPAGYLADKYSSKSVILAGTILGMVFFYVFLFFPLLDDYSLLALLFCLGASISVVQPVALAMGARLMPSRKGMVSAFLMGLVWCVSEVVGQTGGGLLTKCFTDDSAAKALSVLGVMFFMGMVIASQLPAKVNSLEVAENA